jgi:hypothetical protein
MLPENVSVSDARRVINTGLHVGHLQRSTLSVHGVALVKDGRAVLLLGGHGSGKSLTGLAMISAHGWRPVAGDVCLIRAADDGRVTVVGGTRSYVVRRSGTRHWFPGLPFPSPGECIEYADMLEPWYRPPIEGEVPLAAAISVSIGSGPPAEVPRQGQPRHVAVSALYRASSYLIDKVLDDLDADPLRMAEGPERCRLRMRLARRTVARTASWWSGGSPHFIAAEISRAVADGEAGCQ